MSIVSFICYINLCLWTQNGAVLNYSAPAWLIVESSRRTERSGKSCDSKPNQIWDFAPCLFLTAHPSVSIPPLLDHIHYNFRFRALLWKKQADVNTLTSVRMPISDSFVALQIQLCNFKLLGKSKKWKTTPRSAELWHYQQLASIE